MPPKTRTFTIKGLFGIVIWIALWSLIVTAVVSQEAQDRFRAAQARAAR